MRVNLKISRRLHSEIGTNLPHGTERTVGLKRYLESP